jgi:hypothetical protein
MLRRSVLALAAVSLAFGANRLTREEKRDGFELLFDGKSMRRWHSAPRQAGSGPWRVKDGVLRFENGEGRLLTDDSFQEFVLRLEYRGDGGVFVSGDFDVEIPGGGSEWNQVEISVVKKQLAASRNGRQVLDLTLDDKHAFGPIGLRARAANGPVEFRNIRVRVMKIGPLFGPKRDEN